MQLELPVKRAGRGSELNDGRPERAGDRGRAVLSPTGPSGRLPPPGSCRHAPPTAPPFTRVPRGLRPGPVVCGTSPPRTLVHSRAGFPRACQVPGEMRVSPCGSLARPLLGPCGFHSLGTRRCIWIGFLCHVNGVTFPSTYGLELRSSCGMWRETVQNARSPGAM